MCKTCTSRNKCIECNVGYRLGMVGTPDEGKCLACDDNKCAVCDKLTGKCLSCLPGAFMDEANNICLPCTGNCIECTSETVCTKCKPQESKLIGNSCECISKLNWVQSATPNHCDCTKDFVTD